MSIELKPKHRIPVSRGAQMTARYRKEKKRILKGEFADSDILPISETFEKAAIERLLAQPGCTALRVYYSMDEELKVHALLVGVDAENRDILPASTETATLTEEGEVLDEAKRCPNDCPPSSPLYP